MYYETFNRILMKYILLNRFQLSIKMRQQQVREDDGNVYVKCQHSQSLVNIFALIDAAGCFEWLEFMFHLLFSPASS